MNMDTAEWNNLDRIKNNNSTYSKTDLISGTKDTVSATNPYRKLKIANLTLTGFGFQIPTGSKINKVIVEYAHQRLPKDSKYPSIAAPTIKLLGCTLNGTNITETFNSVEGHAPTKNMVARSVTYNGKKTITIGTNVSSQSFTATYNLPSVAEINSSSFGVKIGYPKNTSTNQGYLQLQYIRITVDYTPSEYNVSLNKVTSGDIYPNTPVEVEVNLSNLNLTDYQNNVTVTLPANAVVQSISDNTEYISGSAQGWVKQSNTTYLWTPIQSSGINTCTLILQLLLPEGDQTITARENLNGANGSLTVHVDPYHVNVYDDGSSEDSIYAVQNTYADVTIVSPETCTTMYVRFDNAVTVKINGTESSLSANTNKAITVNGAAVTFQVKTSVTGVTQISTSYDSTNNFGVVKLFKVTPSSISEVPQITAYKLTDEELDRLGDGFTYELSSFIRVLLDWNSNIDKFHNYYRNYRLGICNSIAETSNLTTIFNNAEHWSDVMTTFNSWEEKTVEFTYNSEYPVYLLMTGGYSDEYGYINVEFSQLCLNENINSYENSGIFPEPIVGCITDDEASNVDLEGYATTNNVIFYDFPVDDDFGTNEQYAVRGIQLNFNAYVNKRVVATATLISNNGDVGKETIILNPEENEYGIGGKFKLWGLGIQDMVNLNQWGVKLQFSNLDGDDAEIIIENAEIQIHFQTLDDHQAVDVWVEGENLKWYNVFLQDFSMRAGLRTDTDYINVKGTDTNDPYNMTIETKDIILEFDVDDCNLEDSTTQLQQIVKLMTTKRDSLNRPILKRFEISAYPDQYWMYLLEDGIDAEINLTNYSCKATLTIPAGTSYSKDDTVTNTVGTVDGIAKVNPVISLVPTGEIVTIVEAWSGQKFTMRSTDYIGQEVQIDCQNHKVWLISENPEDISLVADYDAQWFQLDGHYEFEVTNGRLESVTYNERW